MAREKWRKRGEGENGYELKIAEEERQNNELE